MNKRTHPIVRQERDDASLIRDCRNGDEGAWEELIARYRRLIYSIPVAAYRMASSDADEVFQSVVVTMLENLDRLRSAGNLRAWLLTVTRNECKNRLRRIRRFPHVEEQEADALTQDPPDVIEGLHRVDREHRLARALELLDPRSREFLTAFYLEEPRPSYAGIACRLGRPIGSLGPTRARCLEKLRRIYLQLDAGRQAAPLPAAPPPAAPVWRLGQAGSL